MRARIIIKVRGVHARVPGDRCGSRRWPEKLGNVDRLARVGSMKHGAPVHTHRPYLSSSAGMPIPASRIETKHWIRPRRPSAWTTPM
jgi:hypothetical protein